MWQNLKIEEAAKTRLIVERGSSDGEHKYALYLTARKDLLDEVLEEIKAIEPSLTEHGPRHIANVLDNIHLILGEDVTGFSGTELYCLILATLFHDSGNIEGRKGHQHKVGKIYDFVRKDTGKFAQEKVIIMQVVAAHCGVAVDKSNDTLKFLEPTSLDGQPVNLRHIGAVLRLADELAEGHQRTSTYRQQGGYEAGSQIYHKYANATEVCIDRKSNRIALTYNIEVKVDANGSISDEEGLKKLIDYIYDRILKLDQERKYARHYCRFLDPFKEVSTVFNFRVGNQPFILGLSPLILTDLVVPGDTHKKIDGHNHSYSIENVMAKIRDSLSSMHKIQDSDGQGN